MRVDSQVLKQSFKWIVYSLLLVNFALYVNWDWHAATHALGPAEPLIKWLQAYAASIDYAAWLVLIILFELETYILSDAAFTPRVGRLMFGARLLCYLFVLHTVYAYSVNTYENYFKVEQAAGVSDLCRLADESVSFVYNQQYTYLNEDNCADLGTGGDYFLLDKGRVVADTASLARERWLAWLDVAEAVIWLLIMALIELTIRLQDRGISSGRAISTLNYLKFGGYGALVGMAIHWGLTGLFLNFWDEMLWVGGFTAIEMNMSDWREELEEAKVTDTTVPADSGQMGGVRVKTHEDV